MAIYHGGLQLCLFKSLYFAEESKQGNVNDHPRMEGLQLLRVGAFNLATNQEKAERKNSC